MGNFETNGAPYYAEALEIVLDSIYSGDIHVNDENVFEVLLAADHFQVERVNC